MSRTCFAVALVLIGGLVPTFGQMVWHQATPAAAWPARELHTAVVFQDTLWVIYGRQGTATKDVWRSADGADWTLVSAAPGYRNDHASVVFDNKVWVLGGYDTGNYKNDVWYSSDGVTWVKLTTGSPMWTPRIGHEAVVFNGKMWVLGGFVYPGNTGSNDVWYSSDGVNWVLAGNAGWSPRFWHAAVVHNGKIWVMAGYDGTDRNDVWCSSDGVNWTQVTAAANWTPRHLSTLVSFDNKLWLMGGYRDPSHNNEVWYSSDGENWTQATTGVPMWEARQAHVSVVHDGKIWVMGGQRGHNNFLNDVWYSTGLTALEEPGSSGAAPGGVFVLSPNPATSGSVTLKIQGIKESRSSAVNVRVFDASGRCIISYQPAAANWELGTKLDLRKVPAGVYLARVDVDSRSATQKLVVR
ncbi:MAG: T9SS type A sorting domain-containing protein [candidate division WOR-3 bacterium]